MRLVLLLIGVAVFVLCPNVYGQKNAGRVRAEPIQENDPPYGSTQSIAEGLQQNKKQPDTHDEEKRANRDLAAQEEMATWARRTFYGSLAGIIVSAVGLIVIVYSLRLNDDATRTAQAAVRIAEAANEIQSRAWISIDCVMREIHHAKTHLGVDGTYATIFCRIKNHGNPQL